MKKLFPMAALIAAITLVGCAGQLVAPSVSPAGASKATATDTAKFSGLLGFTRTDVQNALDGAKQFNDLVGIQCHMAGLHVLDTIGLPHVKVTGVASLAEDLRVKQRAVTAVVPVIQDMKDKCAGVYNVGQLFRPLFDVLGVAFP